MISYTCLIMPMCPESRNCKPNWRVMDFESSGPCCRHSDSAGHYWWEPQNCRLRRLTASEARQCLNNRHLFFGGDSLTRLILFAACNLYGVEKGAIDESLPVDISCCHQTPLCPKSYKTGLFDPSSWHFKRGNACHSHDTTKVLLEASASAGTSTCRS